MSKRIDHEIRDMVLRGLKMGEAVRVHPNFGSEHQVVRGTIAGWHTGWGPDMVDVEISEGEYWSVPRFAVISAEMYDEFRKWQHRCECGADLREYAEFNAKDMCVDCVDRVMTEAAASEVTA